MKEGRFRGSQLPRFLRDAGVEAVRLTELGSILGMHLSKKGMPETTKMEDTIVIGSQEATLDRLFTLLHEYFHAAYPELSEKEITEEEIKVYSMIGEPVSDERAGAYQKMIDGWKGGWE